MNGKVNANTGFSLATLDALYANATVAYLNPPLYTIVPNVYGYGTDTRAAYDGGIDPIILHVDTLAAGISSTDSTHGSFEWCITRTYPRIVVFDISGVIQCTDYVEIGNSFLAIYGQTAPSHVVFDGEIRIFASDIVIQHLAVRNTHNVSNRDCIGISSYAGPNSNIVIDHCSVSWGTDENIQIWTWAPDNVGVTNVTISNCLVAEGIYNHACGIINSCEGATISGNVIAHHNNRHPYVKEGSHTAFFNNIAYNYTYRMGQISGDYDYNAPCKLDFRGNMAISGPDSGSAVSSYALVEIMADYGGGQELELYMADNIRNSITYANFDVLNSSGLTGYEHVATPLLDLPSGCEPYASTSTYATVLSKAGARPASRDATDTRLINEVSTQTGGGQITSAPSMPTYPSLTSAFVPVADPHSMYDINYTNLEVQIHQLALALE